ncbi:MULTISPECIES: urease accessory protein UreE [Halobacillus]|uniref:urease accessory protein UreE n=1 Tax=Halobacillus TaxID=45667 RepID=UPI000403F54A|nr:MULTISPECIES: urease accessory protein UreE [Halobacillus]
MIIEKVAGNISETNNRAPHVEYVKLESEQLLKRVQRVTTDHGREIGIRLGKNKELSDGDILHIDEKNMIVVSVHKDDVLVIRPKNIREMGDIAHQLGNRHVPAQFEGEEMLVQYDYLIEELLENEGLDYSREERKVPEPFRYIGHSHDD